MGKRVHKSYEIYCSWLREQQIKVNFKDTLERDSRNEWATFRPATTGVGIAFGRNFAHSFRESRFESKFKVCTNHVDEPGEDLGDVFL